MSIYIDGLGGSLSKIMMSDKDIIAKGIQYTMSNGPLKVEKKGSEIKPQLELAIQKYSHEAKECMEKMVYLSGLIIGAGGCPPDSKMSDSDSPLMQYSYDVKYSVNEGGSDNGDESNYKYSSDIRNNMGNYNSSCYRLMEYADEISGLSVIKRNLEDSKKYELNVRQLAALGF
jgi:hypothetical protein